MIPVTHVVTFWRGIDGSGSIFSGLRSDPIQIKSRKSRVEGVSLDLSKYILPNLEASTSRESSHESRTIFVPTRRSTTLSSKVKLNQAINFRGVSEDETAPTSPQNRGERNPRRPSSGLKISRGKMVFWNFWRSRIKNSHDPTSVSMDGSCGSYGSH